MPPDTVADSVSVASSSTEATASIVTFGASASGKGGGSVPAGMTVKGSVSVSVSEVPVRALMPVPPAVTVRLTSTTVLAETSGACRSPRPRTPQSILRLRTTDQA